MNNNFFNEDFVFNGVEIKVRKDGYKHGFYVDLGQGDIELSESGALTVKEEFFEKSGAISQKITFFANSDLEIKRLYTRSGVDTYMEKYPEWNSLVFPTTFIVEPTHFKGYLQSPNGDILALCSKDPIESWSLDYCRAIYGEENHVGHRIYSFCIHFFNREKDVFEGRKGKILKKGEELSFEIIYTCLKDVKEVESFWQSHTLAPYIDSKKWTYELGERLEVLSNGKITVNGPSGENFENRGIFREEGLYTVRSEKNGKISTAKIFARKPLSDYLKFGAECAFKYPQFPSTHAETYYGYFSAFNYAERSGDRSFLEKTVEDFDAFCSVMENDEGNNIVKEAEPKRVQNVSTLISLFVAAYRASKDKKYIDKAIKFAYTLMSEQAEGGHYLGWGYTHYTCVIYPAKSMLELSDLLLEVGGYENDQKAVYKSANAAIRDLSVRLDNIETEGQQTFEDGMISCAALQLGMLALRDKGNRALYTDCAKTLLKKHECLERNLVTDCRNRGCTLRFWESLYDVLIDRNMINSPHGWTSWKIYATYYLYLLTKEVKYLKDTFDAMGAALQCFDLKNEKLNWAFIVDPVLEARVFTDKKADNGLIAQVFGDCYLPMISDWWLSNREKVCYGYAFPHLGEVDDFHQGGCCDNDVHEHIKCMAEAGLNGFIHEEEGETLTYNCELVGETVVLKSQYLKKLYYFAREEKTVTLDGKKLNLVEGMNEFTL